MTPASMMMMMMMMMMMREKRCCCPAKSLAYLLLHATVIKHSCFQGHDWSHSIIQSPDMTYSSIHWVCIFIGTVRVQDLEEKFLESRIVRLAWIFGTPTNVRLAVTSSTRADPVENKGRMRRIHPKQTRILTKHLPKIQTA
jgi:hypothetical protein